MAYIDYYKILGVDKSAPRIRHTSYVSRGHSILHWLHLSPETCPLHSGH